MRHLAHDDIVELARRHAQAAVHQFPIRLAGMQVLEPVCGTGNFLYVALELMKQLEHEVRDLARPGSPTNLTMKRLYCDNLSVLVAVELISDSSARKKAAP